MSSLFTSSVWIRGSKLPGHPPTCLGTCAKCTCAIQMAMYSELARESMVAQKNPEALTPVTFEEKPVPADNSKTEAAQDCTDELHETHRCSSCNDQGRPVSKKTVL